MARVSHICLGSLTLLFLYVVNIMMVALSYLSEGEILMMQLRYTHNHEPIS